MRSVKVKGEGFTVGEQNDPALVAILARAKALVKDFEHVVGYAYRKGYEKGLQESRTEIPDESKIAYGLFRATDDQQCYMTFEESVVELHPDFAFIAETLNLQETMEGVYYVGCLPPDLELIKDTLNRFPVLKYSKQQMDDLELWVPDMHEGFDTLDRTKHEEF